VLPDYEPIEELTEDYHVVHQEHRAPDGGGISWSST